MVRDLGQEDRAGYTEALLFCSVGRRTVVACPLAFGEVGVKERVRAVMNYRRAASWMIVAAVGVSVLVAVCFLTVPAREHSDEIDWEQYRTDYVGDAVKVSRIAQQLPYPGGLRLCFHRAVDRRSALRTDRPSQR